MLWNSAHRHSIEGSEYYIYIVVQHVLSILPIGDAWICDHPKSWGGQRIQRIDIGCGRLDQQHYPEPTHTYLGPGCTSNWRRQDCIDVSKGFDDRNRDRNWPLSLSSTS